MSGKPIKLLSSFIQLRIQKISGQESSFFTIPEIFKYNTRRKRKEQDFFQEEEGKIRPNDPEAVRLSEGSTQKQEMVEINLIESVTLQLEMISPFRMNTVW
ncbi:hypothetical protein O181_112678 [Austropuccinia psidii MF-1]|uniref:Uncharacterized protein n=1 Tax=Austropuccinia psidii MF-1 TaxID=1389203 RepID=A0A9Q3K0X6_9BASI|nr:hypothetical protein [Austropuccinia psidii MF-1]